MNADVRAVVNVHHNVFERVESSGHFLTTSAPETLVELRCTPFAATTGWIGIFDLLEQRIGHFLCDRCLSTKLGTLEDVQHGTLNDRIRPASLKESLG